MIMCCESFALQDSWDRDLTVQELVTERINVFLFDKLCGNPIKNKLELISENYKGDGRT